MDGEGRIFDEVFQKAAGDGLRHAFMQFYIGVLAHPINPDQQVSLGLAPQNFSSFCQMLGMP